MSEIKRYSWHMCGVLEDPSGVFVSLTDHLAALSSSEARVKELEA